ncbi:MAG: GGDEF domain-containing protein [Lachnospiraceae bacterium]|nr:GGDEF domain-containing protein [Lachnospiraceae bacterium]
MKKKIAVCANGWNLGPISKALSGIREYAEKEDFDIFTFTCFATYSEHVTLVQGELNIYDLIKPEDYDGVIVFSTMLNSPDTAVKVCKKVDAAGVPVVSVGMNIPGIYSIFPGNEDGMRQLVEHLIEKHGIKRPFFICGSRDHVDSVERLDITKQVLAEHGIKLTEDDIGYGMWSNKWTADVIDEVLASGRELPDVFICANDIMAMAACTELERKGYLVPRDVLVTGFDAGEEGKIFYPALTTVEQNYEKIGRRACEIIFKGIPGNSSAKTEKMVSRFSCGESCGCKGDIDYAAKRLLYCRHSFQRNSNAKLLEQNERVMRNWLADMPNYQVMKETLQDHYQNNHQFEGSGFYIVMNAEYFEDVMVSEKELWEKGRARRAEIVVALKDGKIRTDLTVDWDMIVPGYEKLPGVQHIYYIMPLHYFENNYGYVVLTDDPVIMSEEMLYPYLEKLQQSLKMMRINLRLKNLYDRDQMTGLLNRFGYEDKALPLYEESLENKTKAMVMFVDINYMKRINDEYGHLHGDNAIKTVVAAINETLRGDDIGVRFGGDEFLVISSDCDEGKAEEKKKTILDFLEKFNNEKTVPYNITVSIGYVVTDPEGRPGASLKDYIREADKLMYDIKKETHKQNDRRASRD